MSENKEAVVVRRPGDEVVELSKNLGGMLELAKCFHQSGMFPQIGNQYAALASIEAGRELGIPPIMALQTIYPIKGRLTIESKGMLALFKQGGGTCKILKRTAEVAEIVLSKPGMGDPETFTFTMAEATKAGLAGKDNWKGYPADMLFARAVSRGIRSYDPGCILGMSSKEEVEDDSDLSAVANITMPKVEVVAVPEKPAKVIEAEVVVEKPAETPAEVAPDTAKTSPAASKRVKPVVPKAQVATPAPAPVLEAEVLELTSPEPTAANTPEPMMTAPLKSRVDWYVEKLKGFGQADIETRALDRIKSVLKDAPKSLAQISDEAAVVILPALKKLYDKELEKRNGI